MAKTRWYSREAKILSEVTGISDPPLAIRKLAADLVDLAGFNEPPFDPEVLASFRDVAAIRRIEMQGAGRLVLSGKGLVIEVNVRHSSGKQNLTINHEISHTLMPSYDGQTKIDKVAGVFDEKWIEEELLCNIGGAALLLEPRWLSRDIREIGPSLELLQFVAKRYRSSLQAAAWQLCEVAPWPCAFIFWEPGLRKSERALAQTKTLPGFEEQGHPVLKWRAKNRYAAATFGNFIPPNQSTDEDLITGCCTSQPFTSGRVSFKFLDHGIPLYCENLYAPFHDSTGLRERIITLVIDPTLSSRSSQQVQSYRIENL